MQKTVALDGAKSEAGATEKRKERKTVAPDGTKLAVEATEKSSLQKTVASTDLNR